MNTTELNKIDRYRHLLPDPAPQVVGQLIEEVRSMREAIKQAHEALDCLSLVVGLTPIAGNKEALQEANDQARAVLTKLQPYLK